MLNITAFQQVQFRPSPMWVMNENYNSVGWDTNEGEKYSLTLFILVCHTSKLNYKITVDTVQCDQICRYCNRFQSVARQHLCKHGPTQK
jgi:hypothetical protein